MSVKFSGCGRTYCENHGHMPAYSLLHDPRDRSFWDKFVMKLSGFDKTVEANLMELSGLSLKKQISSLETLSTKINLSGKDDREWGKTVKYCGDCEEKFLAEARKFRMTRVGCVKTLLCLCFLLIVLIVIIVATLEPPEPAPLDCSEYNYYDSPSRSCKVRDCS